MKKLGLCLLLCVVTLSGCTDKNLFWLHCNTRGFLDYRDLTFKECKCVADQLYNRLSINEFEDLNTALKRGTPLRPNSTEDRALREAGRQCAHPYKKGILE